MGGNGSQGGGGGGAGGRFIINFLRGHVASAQPDQSHYWKGSYSLGGGFSGSIKDKSDYLEGAEGSKGIIESSKCFGGYSGPFCEACPEGSFKYGYSYAVCKPCENKPKNSFYNEIGQATSECAYECSSGLDPVSVNPNCSGHLQLQVERLGGVTISLIVFGSFLGLVLVLWMVLMMHSKSQQKKKSNLNKVVYDGVLFTENEEYEISDGITTPKNMSMQDSDVWSHTARMYLLGDNSVSFPWYIPKDFPSRSLDPHGKEKFMRSIKEDQKVLDWTSLQKDTYVLFRIIYPPLANFVHRCFRKKHLVSFKNKMFETFDSSFWDIRGQRTLRIASSTKDHQLAYIDFLNYDNAKKDYVGPQIPITLLLSGSGTFNSPYQVNFEEDALAKSLVYFHQATLREKLPIFFENLNTLLSKLSFYKFTRQTMRDLSEVVEWIEMGNKTLFNPLDIKATLYLFENSYYAAEGGNFKQKRRNFPMEQIVFESFPDLFKNMIKFIQTKLLGKKSEVRLGLVFKAFNVEKKRKLLDRIRKINAENKAGDVFDQAASTLIYGSDEDEDEPFYPQKRLQVVQGSNEDQQNLGSLRRMGGDDEDSSTYLLTESGMQTSSINIYGSGQKAQEVKIIDKSKRAFDISSDSTKALEISLQKNRSTCKYKCKRINAKIYAFFLLALKFHGKPPSRSTASCNLLTFSFVLTIDAMLTTALGFHIFRPMENWNSFGFIFFLIYPGVTILGPLCGVLGSLFGSQDTLKVMSSMNATAALVNIPLTLLSMIYYNDEPFYIATIITLWFNKCLVSYFSSKVRSHLANPTYTKNSERIDERYQTLIHAKEDIMDGIKPGMSQSERASSLVNSGPPDLAKRANKTLANIEPLDESEDEEGLLR